jgi:hypothetical protein
VLNCTSEYEKTLLFSLSWNTNGPTGLWPVTLRRTSALSLHTISQAVARHITPYICLISAHDIAGCGQSHYAVHLPYLCTRYRRLWPVTLRRTSALSLHRISQAVTRHITPYICLISAHDNAGCDQSHYAVHLPYLCTRYRSPSLCHRPLKFASAPEVTICVFALMCPALFAFLFAFPPFYASF